MSAEWAARDKQPILPTSTNPCITRAAGTQGVKWAYSIQIKSLIERLLFLKFKTACRMVSDEWFYSNYTSTCNITVLYLIIPMLIIVM
jgi:hypothetical protein